MILSHGLQRLHGSIWIMTDLKQSIYTCIFQAHWLICNDLQNRSITHYLIMITCKSNSKPWIYILMKPHAYHDFWIRICKNPFTSTEVILMSLIWPTIFSFLHFENNIATNSAGLYLCCYQYLCTLILLMTIIFLFASKRFDACFLFITIHYTPPSRLHIYIIPVMIKHWSPIHKTTKKKDTLKSFIFKHNLQWNLYNNTIQFLLNKNINFIIHPPLSS